MSTWLCRPPSIESCGPSTVPAGAVPLPVLRRSPLDRFLSPVRFRFVGCREGVPLIEARLLWWHPVAWLRRLAPDTLDWR